MKRTPLILIALLLIAGLVLGACQPAAPTPEAPAETEAAPEEAPEESPEESPEEPPMEEEAEPLLIGSSLPLTGSFSIPGEKHQDGYQLCVDLINDAGGLLDRPVELLVSDNQSDAETAIAQFERFINQDNVDLIFGTFPA